MAELLPFNGIYYNIQRVGTLNGVICPSYDQVSMARQKELKRRHPNNVVHLERPEATEPGYPGLGKLMQLWVDQKVLMRDGIRSFYVLEQKFELHGKTYTRFGLLALVKLEPYDTGTIHPHLDTHEVIRDERLRHLSAIEANTGPVTAAFSETSGRIQRLMELQCQGKPLLVATDEEGVFLQLYHVQDRQAQEKFRKALQKKDLVILDGHHRYEAALEYARGHVGESHEGAQYVLMCLVSATDEALVSLPSHRILMDWPSKVQPEHFLNEARAAFEVNELVFDEVTPERVHAVLNRKGHEPTCVFYRSEDPESLHSLSIRRDYLEHFAGEVEDRAWASVGVNLLTRYVFGDILGLTDRTMDDYLVNERDVETALGKVEFAEAVGAFFMRGVSVDQVMEMARGGTTLPPESTCFWPRVPSGMMCRKI